MDLINGGILNMNYKNLTFPNTTNGFRSWCKAFKHLFHSDIVKTGYYRKDFIDLSLEAIFGGGSCTYYLELNKVKTMNMGNNYFLGISLRRYNEKDRDFDLVPIDQEKEVLKLFDTRIYNFCDRNNLMLEYYKIKE